MKKEQFGRGLQLINAVTTNQIETTDQIDTYYLLLGDLDFEFYINGIIQLLKTKKHMYNPPSPAEIIEYHDIEKSKKYNSNDLLNYIKRDMILFGERNQPNYKKEIKETLSELGGWSYLCLNEKFDEKKFETIYLSKMKKEKYLLEN